ncbi:MAG: GAF domain-containing protein [Planctomycetes bacterium]|nr:GAF domain-containing protein [Planctomycetota bacterium]
MTTNAAVSRADQGADLHRLIFELTSRATAVPFSQFVGEVTAKLAGFYGSSVGRIFLGGSQQPVGAADLHDCLKHLSVADRELFDRHDAQLAHEVRRTGRPAKLSQLPTKPGFEKLLRETLGLGEGYGLPIQSHGKTQGALCLYHRDPVRFSKADLQSLQALGNVLQGSVKQDDGSARYLEDVREKDKKMQHYKLHLQKIEMILEELRALTMARSVLLIERTAEFIAKRGEDLPYDESHLNVLLAGGYEASKRIAGLLGSTGEKMVVHEGEGESVLVKEVASRALLAIIYRDHDVPQLIAEWANSAAARLEEELAALGEVRIL